MKNKYINLRAVLKTIHDHYYCVRAYPNLRRYQGGLGLGEFIRALFEVVPFASTFERRELHDWERQRTLRYSIPDVEKKAIKLFEKAMPHTRKYKLFDIDRITGDEVYREDKNTMKRFRNDKKLRLTEVDFQTMSKSVKYMESKLHVGEKKMKTFEDAICGLTQNTSSCYPLYQKKSSLDVIKDGRNKLEKLLKMDNALDMLNLMNTQVVTVFHRFTTKLKRTSEGCEKNAKIRQVFGQPYFLLVLEAMMFGSALDEISRKNVHSYFSYALTRPEISFQVNQVRRHAQQNNYPIVCADVTQIDSCITPYHIYLVLTFLQSHYKYSSYWLTVFKAYVIWFIFTPVIWSSRRLDWMVGGHLTGSLPTSFVNSYAVLLAITYYKFKYERKSVKPYEVKVLGDDFILAIDDLRKFEKLKYAFSLFNLKLHQDKTIIRGANDRIHYLGFNWDLEGEPHADELWYLSRICFPEKFLKVRGTERIVQRAASILYQIKGGHQIFELVFIRQLNYVKDMIMKGLDPIIEYLDKSGSIFYIRIAYSKLVRMGWRAY